MHEQITTPPCEKEADVNFEIRTQSVPKSNEQQIAFTKASPLDCGCDYLLGVSSVSGYPSAINEERGSWYIQIFCESIAKYGPLLDIVGIHTKTVEEVSKKEGTCKVSGQDVRIRQVPVLRENKLRHLFFFNYPKNH